MKLEVLIQTDPETKLELASFPVVLGRHSECGIRIADAKVSRRHASIELREGRLFLVDLGSGNGTLVNGIPTSGCFLSAADEIRIGETTVQVLAITGEPAGAAPEAPETSLAVDHLRRRRILSRVGPPVLVLLLLAFATWSYLTRAGDREPSPPAGEPDPELDRALAELETLKQKIALASRITPDLVEAAGRLEARWAAQVFPGGYRPFDDFHRSVRSRQRLEHSNRLAAVERDVHRLLEQRAFGDARRKILAEKEELAREGSSLVEVAERVIRETEDAILAAFGRLSRDITYFEEFEDEEEAIRLCEQAMPAFAQTEHAATLEERLAHLKDALAARERARREDEERLAARIEEAREKARERSAPQHQGLSELLATAVAAGRLEGVPFRFPSGVEGIPVEVTPEIELVVKGEAESRRIPFAEIPAEIQFEMGRKAVQGADLLAVARYGYRQRLSGPADLLLHEYLQEAGADRAIRKSEVDRTLAEARGLREVPEGGYSYSREHGWEDANDRARRAALDAAAQLSNYLALQSTPEGLRRTWQKMLSHLDDARLSVETRGQVRRLAIEGLCALRGKIVERLSESVARQRFTILRRAHEELNRRRAAALKIILDTEIYLPENHPEYPRGDEVNGQKAVDLAVDAVRELWDMPTRFAAGLDPRSRKQLEMVQLIDGECFETLRHQPADESSGFLDEIARNADSSIDLRRYAAHQDDLDDFKYNRQVEEHNRSLQDPDLSDAEKAHVALVNDYREMLGLRRLFIDLRLCRATSKHSEVCDAAGRIWHSGPDGSPASRARAEGFPGGVAENVAIGHANPEDIWTRGWYRASDHHRNALGAGHQCIGYGYSGRVGTQNFSRAPAPFGRGKE